MTRNRNPPGSSVRRVGQYPGSSYPWCRPKPEAPLVSLAVKNAMTRLLILYDVA